MNRSGYTRCLGLTLLYFLPASGCELPHAPSGVSVQSAACTWEDKTSCQQTGGSPAENHGLVLFAQDVDPFDKVDELSADLVVQLVLARNPTLAEMTAAWQAASARYPQATSLEDPMFGTTLAPASIGSNDVEFGFRVEIAQKGRGIAELRRDEIEAGATSLWFLVRHGRACPAHPRPCFGARPKCG